MLNCSCSGRTRKHLCPCWEGGMVPMVCWRRFLQSVKTNWRSKLHLRLAADETCPCLMMKRYSLWHPSSSSIASNCTACAVAPNGHTAFCNMRGRVSRKLWKVIDSASASSIRTVVGRIELVGPVDIFWVSFGRISMVRMLRMSVPSHIMKLPLL